MGSSLSLFLNPRGSVAVPPANPGLGDLPESCVASVMVYLNPSEICSLSMLNRGFRAASSADFVWESKLPINYELLIDRVFGGVDDFSNNLCKRDIYARLCRPSYFDGGSKKVWLDKGTGRVCLSISANGLAITGIDDRRYWSRIETDESRFLFTIFRGGPDGLAWDFHNGGLKFETLACDSRGLAFWVELVSWGLLVWFTSHV
ncbi:hypothetical protein H5410_062940 [Solanum commersonii]|uniref:F-box domain-containing protein n=1 Tax=Solanum commersonii TaxID=4109 RepID=A0A9J5WE63_SOLCO|nr:hypothetical protein H5410_062940 [Solanum commersonii]